MRVTFHKRALGRCYWEAVRTKRARVPGCQMGGYVRPGALPHDLAQFVVEAGLGLRHGFWGLVADGATFESLGKRRTREGRAVIRAHRDALNAAEALVNAEVQVLEAGGYSVVREEFDRIATQWAQLPEGGTLELVWSAPVHDLLRSARTRS
jgi:hypothetical protein